MGVVLPKLTVAISNEDQGVASQKQHCWAWTLSVASSIYWMQWHSSYSALKQEVCTLYVKTALSNAYISFFSCATHFFIRSALMSSWLSSSKAKPQNVPSSISACNISRPSASSDTFRPGCNVLQLKPLQGLNYHNKGPCSVPGEHCMVNNGTARKASEFASIYILTAQSSQAVHVLGN